LIRVKRTIDRIYGVLRDAQAKFGPLPAAETPGADFMSALLDDLNTPEALAEINKQARKLANANNAEAATTAAGNLLASGVLIGLFQQDPKIWLAGDIEGLDDTLIDELIEKRNAARAEKNFERADEIREQLKNLGIDLEDVADGTRWRRI
jgi:cysteinyl-tRNA synthetase